MNDEDPIELCNQADQCIATATTGLNPTGNIAMAVLALSRAVRQLAKDARDRETAELERNERG